MKQIFAAALVSAGLVVSAPTLARGITVEITNLTNGTHFTPLLVAAHNRRTHLFQVGMEASDSLQAMAEGGDISGLSQDVTEAGGVVVEDPAEGFLAPGETASATLYVYGHRRSHLSIVAMLLPTNDGFVGLDALKIPFTRGIYTYYLNGYDAGTEANDEIVNGGGAPGTPGIPADPGDHAGVGGTGAAGADTNHTVHVHRSILGDDDPTGGVSDLDRSIHRWLNPVAKVVIRR
jgi:hypothetical protein